MRLTAMVNIYCPACHISSPRHLREVVQPRAFCTVCGAPLDPSLVEEAVARCPEASATGPDNIDGQPVSMHCDRLREI
jgi:hypothetical protein